MPNFWVLVLAAKFGKRRMRHMWNTLLSQTLLSRIYHDADDDEPSLVYSH